MFKILLSCVKVRERRREGEKKGNNKAFAGEWQLNNGDTRSQLRYLG